MTTGNSSSRSASPARVARPGRARICLRLIDNATKTNPGQGGADAGLCREKCLPRTDHSAKTAELSVSVVGPHLPCLGNDRASGPGPTEMTNFTSRNTICRARSPRGRTVAEAKA